MAAKMKDGLIKRGKTWSYVARIRDAQTGHMKAHWVGGFASQADARRARDDTRDRVHKGTAVAPATLTLADYLATWLRGLEAQVRPTTFASYSGHVRVHIVPAIGQRRLQSLRAGTINAFYADLLKEGRRHIHQASDAPAGLSGNTVRRIAATLHRALRDATDEGLLARNPADRTKLPKATAQAGGAPHDLQVWTEAELADFLAATRSGWWYPLFRLAATTGMRRGELAGLRWADVDLKMRQLAVRQTIVVVGSKLQEGSPKTTKGRRTIALDEETVQVLRAHRKVQAAERLALAGAAADSGLVFTQEDGQPVHPRAISRAFGSAVKRADLPPIRFHDLRHTHASLLLKHGVPAKVVSERLGHATVAFTMDVYQHVLPGMQEDAATRFATLLLAQGTGSVAKA